METITVLCAVISAGGAMISAGGVIRIILSKFATKSDVKGLKKLIGDNLKKLIELERRVQRIETHLAEQKPFVPKDRED